MKKQFIIDNRTFQTQNECENYTRNILNELGLTHSVKLKNSEYFRYLCLLCKRHPHYDEKFKKFVDFQVRLDAMNQKGLALHIVNCDGTFTEISWRKCITGKSTPIKTLFCSALRFSIKNQIKDFRDKSDLSYCRLCNCSLTEKRLHIDHHEKQFIQLVEDFLELNKGNISIPTKYSKKELTFETLFANKDAWIGESFEKYHLQNATLRVLCETCNTTREKYKVTSSAFENLIKT